MIDDKSIITIKPPKVLKHLKGDDGYRTFSVRIKEETVLKVEDISKRTGRSRNELFGLLVEIGIANSEVESKQE